MTNHNGAATSLHTDTMEAGNHATQHQDNKHQYAMSEALRKWSNVTSAFTYRSLVDILIKLRKRTVAENVCRTGELFRASYTQCALSLFIVLY